MSNSRGRNSRRGGRTTPKGTRPLHLVHTDQPRPPRPAPEPVDLVAQALDADGPLPLLALVSTMLWTLRPDAPGRPPDVPPLADVVEAWIDANARTTTALLAVAAQMAPDAELRELAAWALTRRHEPAPAWLPRLPEARVTSTVLVTHVLGDGDLHLLELELPGAGPITLDVYVDHNLGTAVKSAFAVPEPIDELRVSMAELLDDPDTTVTDVDPADARARLEEALANPLSLGLLADHEETWPRSRPLLEWALRLLPAGGSRRPHTTWTPKARDALVDRFFDSPWGRPQRDAERRYILGLLLDLREDGLDTDIARWSPEVVATLVERIVEERDLDPDDVRVTPDLLRGFVGFCHGERAIPTRLTEDTLAVVDHLVPSLQRHAIVAAQGFDWDAPAANERYVLQSLAEEVGGEHALLGLDDVPLPDEPFDWTAVDPQVHDQVAPILTVVDHQCEQHFDLELRTAARRLIARAAKGDPAVFARTRKPETAAAALVWIVASANDAFARHGLLIRDFVAGLGLTSSSPSQRAEVFLRAAGIEPFHYGRLTVGDPDLLTSAHRRALVERRDRYLVLIDEHDDQWDP